MVDRRHTTNTAPAGMRAPPSTRAPHDIGMPAGNSGAAGSKLPAHRGVQSADGAPAGTGLPVAVETAAGQLPRRDPLQPIQSCETRLHTLSWK